MVGYLLLKISPILEFQTSTNVLWRGQFVQFTGGEKKYYSSSLSVIIGIFYSQLHEVYQLIIEAVGYNTAFWTVFTFRT